MQIPTQTPEAKLVEELRQAVRPKLSVRRAATMAGISEGRWRQIAKGYNQVSKDTFVESVAPADTLARMARAVGATPDQLREVGRKDAADELAVLYGKDREFREVKRQVGDIYDAMQRQPDEVGVIAEIRIRSAGRLLDSATDALANSDHARAIEDLDSSAVIIRSTIAELEKGQSHDVPVDQTAQSDAQAEGAQDEEVTSGASGKENKGEEARRVIRPAHWNQSPPPPTFEEADAASQGYKRSDDESDDEADASDDTHDDGITE